MTQAEHRAAFAVVGMAGRLLLQYDLDQLLKDMEHSEDFGCFFDPTAWMNNIEKLKQDREVIEAALPLWRLAKKLKDRAEGK